MPGGKLPVLRFRTAVGREALCDPLCMFCGFFVVTMLLLVVLAGSFTPCAKADCTKAGCARKAKTSKTAENARMVEHRDDGSPESCRFSSKSKRLAGGLLHLAVRCCTGDAGAADWPNRAPT